jgi:hypothetical protein
MSREKTPEELIIEEKRLEERIIKEKMLEKKMLEEKMSRKQTVEEQTVEEQMVEVKFDSIYKQLLSCGLTGPDFLRILDTIIFTPIRQEIDQLLIYFKRDVYIQHKINIEEIENSKNLEERNQLLFKHYFNWYQYIQLQFKHVLKDGIIDENVFKRILDTIPNIVSLRPVGLKIYTDIIMKNIKDIETALNEKVNEMNNFITYTSAYEETNLSYYIVPRRAFLIEWFKYYYMIIPPTTF